MRRAAAAEGGELTWAQCARRVGKRRALPYIGGKENRPCPSANCPKT